MRCETMAAADEEEDKDDNNTDSEMVCVTIKEMSRSDVQELKEYATKLGIPATTSGVVRWAATMYLHNLRRRV